jgi:hypothetical protein
MKLKIGGKVALVEEITSGAIQSAMKPFSGDFWLEISFMRTNFVSVSDL